VPASVYQLNFSLGRRIEYLHTCVLCVVAQLFSKSSSLGTHLCSSTYKERNVLEKSLIGNLQVMKLEDNRGVIIWTTKCDNSLLLNSCREKNGEELIVVTESYKLIDVRSITPQNTVFIIFCCSNDYLYTKHEASILIIMATKLSCEV